MGSYSSSLRREVSNFEIWDRGVEVEVDVDPDGLDLMLVEDGAILDDQADRFVVGCCSRRRRRCLRC